MVAGQSATPSKQEISVAVADVRCKERADLVEVWHAAEVRIQKEEIGRHRAYFQELRTAMDDELDAAEAVLG